MYFAHSQQIYNTHQSSQRKPEPKLKPKRLQFVVRITIAANRWSTYGRGTHVFSLIFLRLSSEALHTHTHTQTHTCAMYNINPLVLYFSAEQLSQHTTYNIQHQTSHDVPMAHITYVTYGCYLQCKYITPAIFLFK